jgi:DNA adenine methylase
MSNFDSADRSRLQSFLRWVGGKRLHATRLLSFLPADATQRRYREPFAGAASLFFALRPERAALSDLNGHLIECYRFVRDEHRSVAAHLRRHATAHSEGHYYQVRNVYNSSGPSAAQAARFIYLNATCFNGVFRVNRQGRYNVPVGDKSHPQFPTESVLRQAGDVLRNARLTICDYATALRRAKPDDLVYLDPPYPPLNGTSFFTHYTPDRFSLEEQIRLANAFAALHRVGCALIMTNADTPLVRRLYARFYLTPLRVTRYVTCRKRKNRVGEIVITNYAPPIA